MKFIVIILFQIFLLVLELKSTSCSYNLTINKLDLMIAKNSQAIVRHSQQLVLMMKGRIPTIITTECKKKNIHSRESLNVYVFQKRTLLIIELFLKHTNRMYVLNNRWGSWRLEMGTQTTWITYMYTSITFLRSRRKDIELKDHNATAAYEVSVVNTAIRQS